MSVSDHVTHPAVRSRLGWRISPGVRLHPLTICWGTYSTTAAIRWNGTSCLRDHQSTRKAVSAASKIWWRPARREASPEEVSRRGGRESRGVAELNTTVSRSNPAEPHRLQERELFASWQLWPLLLAGLGVML